MKRENYLPLITRGCSMRIAISDIVRIEQEGRKLCVITENKRFYYYGKMKEIRPLLDERFFPCMNGCVLNLDWVLHMESNCIVFGNGDQIIIGRRNFQRARQAFNAYLRKYTEMAHQRAKTAHHPSETVHQRSERGRVGVGGLQQISAAESYRI